MIKSINKIITIFIFLLIFQSSLFAVPGDPVIENKQATIIKSNEIDAGLLKLIGSSSGYVGFQGKADAGSTIYILPDADGTPGQILQTDGASNLSWVDTPAAMPLTTDGDLLFYNSGLARLPAGSELQVLTMISGFPSWQTLISKVYAENLDIGPGVEVVDSFSKTDATAAFWNITVYKGTDRRVCRIEAVWEAVSENIDHKETCTLIGADTPPFTLTINVDIVGGLVRLTGATVSETGWAVKSKRELL